MAKQSLSLLFRNYIWLVDTIYSAGHITREEINRKWSRSIIVNPDQQPAIPERTFHNWRKDIEDLFQVIILCDHNTKSYYIDNAENMREDGFRAWLINGLAVQAQVADSRQLSNQILYEDVPSGQRFLTPLIEAMRDHQQVQITYRKFETEEPRTFVAKPFCLKVFAQRWYLLAKADYRKSLRVYALDRVLDMKVLGTTYTLPKQFDAELYFYNTVGVSGMDMKVEQIRLKVSSRQANYVRSLPLHHSQKEEERTEEYSIFTYFVSPSYEFRHEVRKMGVDAEILAPKWLREEFASEYRILMQKYED